MNTHWSGTEIWSLPAELESVGPAGKANTAVFGRSAHELAAPSKLTHVQIWYHRIVKENRSNSFQKKIYDLNCSGSDRPGQSRQSPALICTTKTDFEFMPVLTDPGNTCICSSASWKIVHVQTGSFHDRPYTRPGIFEHPRLVLGHFFLIRRCRDEQGKLMDAFRGCLKRRKGLHSSFLGFLLDSSDSAAGRGLLPRFFCGDGLTLRRDDQD